MSSVTLFGGVSEIGGNKILLEDNGTKIFLDFGQSFSHLDEYFAEYLQPRTRFGLRDQFALGLMPQTKGLYNSWAIEKTDISYSEPEYHAVFITHPHYDHLAHIRYLDQKIPIHMGETAKTILRSVNETGKANIFHEKESKTYDGTVIPANDVRTFRTGDKVKVDDIEVMPVHVDHSVPGAYGFIVHTTGGTVCYTGDIRKHGNRPQMTQDFIEKAKENSPDVLIIEGTRVAPTETRKNYSESSVYEKSSEIVQKDEIVLAMRYPKDLDRFRTFYNVARESGKYLVISLKTAHMLQSLKEDGIGLPVPFEDETIRVYKREMKIYKDWEKVWLEKCVDHKWIAENQKKVIWELDFFQLTELIDVKPGAGSCIHSMSEPFEEDPMSQLQDNVMKNWLERFSLEHHQLHASGHASMDEIFEMINEISAKKVIPIHSQYPELFKGENIVIAEKEKKIEIN
ncbi:MBL fold metallo-hydrolase [Candidatus Micrarchaeota archaeon]|nr:MBL fold metallo-hydrolase [Candidatus Micrarchaeota archaeon]